MQIERFLRPKILIISGKGGVGKTTVAAALALVAARHDRKVCIAEVDRKGNLPRLFGGGELSYEPAEVSPGVWGMNIIPDLALAEYLDVQYHMKRISKIFTSSQFVDYITTAAPGLKDILVLGKIWYLEQNRQDTRGEKNFDTIVVDAPAAGHMLTFLSAPMGLSDALRVGPVRRQSDWLVQMLRDSDRSRVHLVTLPEEMPIVETLETSQAIHERLGIDAGAVFANAVLRNLLTTKERATLEQVMEDDDPAELQQAASEVGLKLERDDLNALVGYERFLEARSKIHAKHLRDLRKGIDDPIIELPYLFSAGLELPDVETLADVIEEQVTAL